MKRTIKKTVLLIRFFDKVENQVKEKEVTTLETNQRKIEKFLKNHVDASNIVLIDIKSQFTVKETYEMDNETFFKHAKLVK